MVADEVEDEQADTSLAVDKFTKAMLDSPWGSVSKSEIDLLIFTLLMDSGRLGAHASDFSIADLLSTTPARVRNLRFRYDQRIIKEDPEKLASMMVAKNFSFASTKSTDVLDVTIHRTYLRHYFVSKLEERRAMTYERTPSVLSMNREEFVRILIEGATSPEWLESDAGSEEFSTLLQELLNSKNRSEAEGALARMANNLPAAAAAVSDGLGAATGLGGLMMRFLGHS
jgi:hypothetical protein